MQRAGTPLPEAPPPAGMQPWAKAVLAALLVAMLVLGGYYATRQDPHPGDDHIEADLIAAGVDPLVAHGLAHDYAWEETCTEQDQWRRKILLRLVTERTPASDPLLTEAQAQVYEQALNRECMDFARQGGGDE